MHNIFEQFASAASRFPDRTVYLTGEIIHNPHVNHKLRASGIRFLDDPGEEAERLGPSDVVILPAFGVTVSMLAQLDRQGCTMVDTTCGSVLNVWKNVERYARDGFTSLVHGKVSHEETRATVRKAIEESVNTATVAGRTSVSSSSTNAPCAGRAVPWR